MENFIAKSVDKEYRKEINDTIKGGFIRNKEMVSRDNRYQLFVSTGNHATIFNLKDHNFAWIYDTAENVCYLLSAFYYAPVKRAIKSVDKFIQ